MSPGFENMGDQPNISGCPRSLAFGDRGELLHEAKECRIGTQVPPLPAYTGPVPHPSRSFSARWVGNHELSSWLDPRMTPHPANLNLIAGWLGMLAGVLSGAVIGLFFHDEKWMGGYASYRRRLARLGHIAFFGLGFLNLIFAATSAQLPLTPRTLAIASWALILAAITM